MTTSGLLLGLSGDLLHKPWLNSENQGIQNFFSSHELGETWSYVWPWLLVIGILFFLVLAAKSIKNEKDIYIDHGHWKGLGHFLLKIPPWWTVKLEKHEHLIEFYRADTHYDWNARFQIFPHSDFPDKLLTLEEMAKSFLRKQQIELDPNAISHRGKSPFESNFQEGPSPLFYNIENTGTKNGLDRIYYHLVIISWPEKNQLMIATSEASVLNGCVEGPYFEEVIKSIKPKI